MSKPLVVLVRPRNHDNLLAIATAMKTFGLREWVAVIPEEHFTRMKQLAAMKNGEAAGRSLDSLRRVETLEEAVAGFEVVVGTTMRELPGKPRFTARELAGFQAQSPGAWALVFGAEANGLTDADLKPCNALAYLPTLPDQPSVNLSQAVVLFAYELQATKAPAFTDVRGLRVLREVLADQCKANGLPRREADQLMAPVIRGG
ncbi:MAG: TrmH family RNA methyltransferase [Archangium sp.]